jgi:mono/diheme cytochrome c family protein
VSGRGDGYDGRVMRVLLLALSVLASLSPFVFAGNNYDRPPAQLYRRHCVSCHGNDGRAKTSKGKFSHARDLSDAEWQADVSDERIFNSIMNGRNVRGKMPAFANKLNEKEAESLVDFVRRLKGNGQ